MDKIMCFYIFPPLMFFIMFVFVMHFHNHLCISISHTILKEMFAEKSPLLHLILSCTVQRYLEAFYRGCSVLWVRVASKVVW